jgi:hypothetical protein
MKIFAFLLNIYESSDGRNDKESEDELNVIQMKPISGDEEVAHLDEDNVTQNIFEETDHQMNDDV